MKALLIAIFLSLLSFADTQNITYEEKLIKNRAHKQEIKGISKHQRKLYYYADDKTIEKELKKEKKIIKVASPTISKNSKAREMQIYVKTKKPIIAKKVNKIEIASPTIDHRSMLKKIEVNLNLKKVEIK
ncbi:MAG: hypothetical protein GXO31_07520 [Epsilonproteobacteria bacterium]|nr:hypothetical protein [Campylobacterota bacterium]